MRNVVKKIENCGNRNILLCERGSIFGYNSLIVDMTSIVEMKKLGYPVVFDATHSVQKPEEEAILQVGIVNILSLWQRLLLQQGQMCCFLKYIRIDHALSDGPNMVRLDEFEDLLHRVIKVYRAVEE